MYVSVEFVNSINDAFECYQQTERVNVIGIKGTLYV